MLLKYKTRYDWKKIKMVVKMKDYDQHMMDSSYCIKADPNSNVAVLKL